MEEELYILGNICCSTLFNNNFKNKIKLKKKNKKKRILSKIYNNIKKEDLELYEVLDRKPIIFEKNKHILNIVNTFLKFNLPNEIKYKIANFLFYSCMPINLKILDFLIMKKPNNLFDKIFLNNSNIEYIEYMLENAGYNTIFFENYNGFIPYKICNNNKVSIKICNNNNNKNNLMILTNCINPYYDNDDFLDIINDNIKIYNFKRENIETCLDLENVIIDNINYIKDYFHYFNYKEDYANFINKPLSAYESAIHACICWICDRFSTNLICGDKYEEPSEIALKDFLYLLIEYTLDYGDFNCIIILIFQNKYISLGHTYYNKGVTVIEVFENGDITIPDYTFEEIYKMEKWNVEDILNYEFLIKNKI